jgi:hypothetical protein
MSDCANAGVGTTSSSAPRTASPTSGVARASFTSRRPLMSFSVIDCESRTGANAATSRRQKRTS